jgi:hypothetical protein
MAEIEECLDILMELRHLRADRRRSPRPRRPAALSVRGY